MAEQCVYLLSMELSMVPAAMTQLSLRQRSLSCEPPQVTGGGGVAEVGVGLVVDVVVVVLVVVVVVVVLAAIFVAVATVVLSAAQEVST